MQRKVCQQIKTRVLEYIAPTNYGRVSLNDAYRLFSNLGSRSEIEKCLDELVGSKIAQKTETTSGIFYVFSEIALKFGQKWKNELEGLKTQITSLENETRTLEKRIETNGKVRDIWLEGWKDALQDPETYASVHNYISSVFFGQRIACIFDDLTTKNKTVHSIQRRIREKERRIKDSYQTI
jgi:hypothetical protein